ncbi:MAG: hypothetical protein FJ265_10215 [Planctomycetes bacterium]|nr:hypothetical protein [Planctomycetota bacterium]
MPHLLPDRSTLARAVRVRGLAVASALSCLCAAPAQGDSFTVLVMDPLASKLACACVAGYAQRDYAALGTFLQARLGQPVRTVHAESLVAGTAKADGRVDLVIGKHSVVVYDARAAQLPVVPLLSLSGTDGATTQRGLVVVRGADPAQQFGDLRGYRLLLGPAEAEEKHAAALALWQRAGLPAPAPLETFATCSIAAQALLALPAGERAAALVSSYAKPLLEGCGTIDAGALRVVGETAPVAFVTAFATSRVAPEDLAGLRRALLAVGSDEELCAALETRDGFVAYRAPVPAPVPWPGWRGAARDGFVPWLPDRLPQKPAVAWERRLHGQGLGGLAATGQFVIVGDRDDNDTEDLWLCLDAATGDVRWRFASAAPGELDYGNSPRATPLLAGDAVFLLGALGNLHCVDLATGRLRWQVDFATSFPAELPTWGFCGSPLLADGALVIAPGAPDASLVGLDPATGKLRWQTAGGPPAYASFLVAHFGGRRQLVGCDAGSFGGFDPATGERLWRLAPAGKGDFFVPTPLAVDGSLVFCSENHGTRLHRGRPDGTIDPEPAARCRDLAPDTTTPVVANGRLFGVWEGMHCLDVAAGLRPVWTAQDRAYGDHASLFASPAAVLVVSARGELVLLDAKADEHRVLGRQWAFDPPCEVYSHPALVGDRLYVRGPEAIRCLVLGAQ